MSKWIYMFMDQMVFAALYKSIQKISTIGDYVFIYYLNFTSKLYPNNKDKHCITSYTRYIKIWD